MSRKTFYIYSSISIFFQFYFLILAKDFTDDFYLYSANFDFKFIKWSFWIYSVFFQNKGILSIRKEILIFYLCLKFLIFIFCSIKYDFLIGFVFIVLSLNLFLDKFNIIKAAYNDMLTSNSKYLLFCCDIKVFFSVYFSILLEASFLNLIFIFYSNKFDFISISIRKNRNKI